MTTARLFRRHQKHCTTGRKKGRAYDACDCAVWIDRTVDGRRTLASAGTRDIEQAELILRPGGEVELAAAADRWAEHLAYLNRKPRTRAKYASCVQAFVARCKEWGFSRPSQVRKEAVEQFVATYQASASKAKALSILQLFGRFCQDQGWAASNPARLVASPKIRGMSSPTPISAEGSCALIERFSTLKNRQMAVLAQLLYETGIRLGDALQLEMSGIQGGRLAIRTEKTGGQVPAIPLSPILYADLAELATDGRIFLQPGQSLRTLTRQVQRQFKKAFEAAGMPKARIHDFRHSAASRWAAKGATVQEIAMLLGISETVAYKTYIHFTNQWHERMDSIVS